MMLLTFTTLFEATINCAEVLCVPYWSVQEYLSYLVDSFTVSMMIHLSGDFAQISCDIIHPLLTAGMSRAHMKTDIPCRHRLIHFFLVGMNIEQSRSQLGAQNPP